MSDRKRTLKETPGKVDGAKTNVSKKTPVKVEKEVIMDTMARPAITMPESEYHQIRLYCTLNKVKLGDFLRDAVRAHMKTNKV